MLRGKAIAIVLAGGKSSRMGTNKALLHYKGDTLAGHMIGVARRSGVDEVYLSGSIEGHCCILDSVPGRGPLGGIQSVLEFLKQHGLPSHLLAVPVDMPLLSSQALQALLLNGAKEDAALYYEGCVLPALFQITHQLQEQTQQLLTGPRSRCSVNALLDGLSARALEIPRDFAQEFINANTPSEWRSVGGNL